MVMMAFVLIVGILGGGLDESSAYGANVALPITITGDIQGSSITMDISGGINAAGIKGSVNGKKFTASSKNSEVQLDVPAPPARTDFFSYMPQFDQRLYSIKLDTSSPQFKLNQLCRTDAEGFRRKGDAYLVAMGTYYGGRDNIGDQYKLTFSGGTANEIIVVLGDCKSDAETDVKHQYHEKGDKTVVEFIMGARDSKNNSINNEKFGTLIGISKIGILRRPATTDPEREEICCGRQPLHTLHRSLAIEQMRLMSAAAPTMQELTSECRKGQRSLQPHPARLLSQAPMEAMANM